MTRQEKKTMKQLLKKDPKSLTREEKNQIKMFHQKKGKEDEILIKRLNITTFVLLGLTACLLLLRLCFLFYVVLH